MQVGLLWYDRDPRKSLAQKIEDATQRYVEKFRRRPDTCHVNPGDHQAVEAPLRLVANPLIQRNTLWVGIEEAPSAERAERFLPTTRPRRARRTAEAAATTPPPQPVSAPEPTPKPTKRSAAAPTPATTAPEPAAAPAVTKRPTRTGRPKVVAEPPASTVAPTAETTPAAPSKPSKSTNPAKSLAAAPKTTPSRAEAGRTTPQEPLPLPQASKTRRKSA